MTFVVAEKERAVSKWICIDEFEPDTEWSEYEDGFIAFSKGQIYSAPSIDIVFCKECKHWHREINENGVEYVNFSKCIRGHYGNGLDFHCADGERREL